MMARKLDEEPPVVDLGTAPEVFADGICEPEIMGSFVRFQLTTTRRRSRGKEREVVLNVVVPIADAERMLRTVNAALLPVFSPRKN